MLTVVMDLIGVIDLEWPHNKGGDSTSSSNSQTSEQKVDVFADLCHGSVGIGIVTVNGLLP